MYKIAVLASGSGSNLQSIIDEINKGNLECEIDCIICDRSCYSIERGKENNIETFLLDRKVFGKDLSNEIEKVLDNKKIDLIVLAGFLSILSNEFVTKWNNKIINIHPSLLPKYGGFGMHGIKVHEAVINNKEKESGCSVHYVTEQIDGGAVIDREVVEVLSTDDAKSLQQRILKSEHILLPRAIKKIINKEK